MWFTSRRSSYRIGIASAVVIVWALAAAAPGALASGSGLRVIEPDDAVAQTGKSYGAWSALWWQTMLKLPVPHNPILDPTGTECQGGNAKRVFFLAGDAGGAVQRTCTVPAGKPLFFPILNTECSNVESPPFFGGTDKQLLSCARGMVDAIPVGSMQAELDGRPVHDLEDFRAASRVFTFTMPASASDNFLGVNASGGRSAADGYYLLLAPPAPGHHTIHFKGGPPSPAFNLDVTYALTVLASDQD